MTYKYVSTLGLFVLILFCNCKKDNLGTNNSTTSSPNLKPVANAGLDKTVAYNLETCSVPNVTIDGSQSFDPDGQIVQYSWRINNSSHAFLNPDNSAIISVENLVLSGVTSIILTVKDNKGLTSNDTVTITVIPGSRAITPANFIPIMIIPSAENLKILGTTNNKIIIGIDNSSRLISEFYIFNITTQSLELKTIPNSRYGVASPVMNDKIYFAGGVDQSNNFSKQIDIYNILSDSWSTAQLSVARAGVSIATNGDKIYFAGGADRVNANGFDFSYSDVIDIYNVNTNSWSINYLSEAKGSISSVSNGNKIYFAGGVTNNSTSAKIEIFDANTGSITFSSLSWPSAGLSAIALNNNLYWAGGGGNKIEIHNLNNSNITFKCLSFVGYCEGTAIEDNIIFYPRHFDGFSPQIPVKKIDIYNSTSNSWTSIPISISKLSMVVHNNIVYALGRDDNSNHLKLWRLVF